MQLQLTLTCTEPNALLNYAIVGSTKFHIKFLLEKLKWGKKKALLQKLALVHA